jgi:hypothetical protein
LEYISLLFYKKEKRENLGIGPWDNGVRMGTEIRIAKERSA